MAATCLHYGQEAFEGLKAFRGKDGKVRIFRLEENAARLQSTCQGILMAELPTERFKEAILKVVKLNERFIPPYETGASLYIRPLLIGTSAQVGVHPAEEYIFFFFCNKVELAGIAQIMCFLVSTKTGCKVTTHFINTCLHYGQEAFEGLKAFRGKDGKVRIFRLEENAARLQSTCQGILMAELPTERFKEAILKVVKLNERFIPPYETGASLYIRPLLIGTSAQVGVHPAEEYMFVVFVTPVGPYFKGGFSTNPYVIIREFDRAAMCKLRCSSLLTSNSPHAPLRKLILTL